MNSKLSVKKEKEKELVENDSDDNKSNENSDNDSDKQTENQNSEPRDNVDEEKEVAVTNKKVHFNKREKQETPQDDEQFEQLSKRAHVLKHTKKSPSGQKVRASLATQQGATSGETLGIGAELTKSINELKFKLNSLDSKLNLLNLKLNSLDNNKSIDKLNNIIGERLDELAQKVESLSLIRRTKPEKSVPVEHEQPERRPQPVKKTASYAPPITHSSEGNVSYGQKRRKN